MTFNPMLNRCVFLSPRLQRPRVRFPQLLLHISHQTAMRRSFCGVASVTMMQLFAVTPVMKTYTATAASGSLTVIYYIKCITNSVFSQTFHRENRCPDARERCLGLGVRTVTQIDPCQALAILLSSMDIKYLLW